MDLLLILIIAVLGLGLFFILLEIGVLEWFVDGLGDIIDLIRRLG